MAISGTIPQFDNSLVAGPSSTATVVTVTGAATGLADGAFSSEDQRAFLVRVAAGISMSGTLADDADTVSGLQAVSGAVLSAVRNIQREVVMRVADLDTSGDAAAVKLARAQAQLTTAGEVQLGS